MLASSFIITQTYSYNDRAQIENILNFDSIGKVTFYESEYEKIIEYQIDIQKCIRLRDLVYWIESNFVRFHLGQLLILFSELVKKAQTLKEQNIEHNNLDMNRIWLQMKEGSQIPSIVYIPLQYTICFTGYQCPLYENSSYSQNFDYAIKQIILSIIKKCQNQIKITSSKDDISRKIYQPIIDLCSKKEENNEDLLKFLQLLLTNSEQQSQALPCDEMKANLKRSNRLTDVEKDMRKIMQKQLNRNPFDLEVTYFLAVPFLVNKITNGIMYSNEDFEYTEVDKFCESARNELNQAINQDGHFQKFILLQLDQFIQDHQKLLNLQFKFTDQELDQLLSEIFEEVKQLKTFNYFYNTFWIHLMNYHEIVPAMQVIITKKIIEIIQVSYQESLYLKKIAFLSKLK